ncbi:MAG TPA: lysylphosphatidylglycerol synthase transmembrane domain-containing protein [bacterium]|nr:lysylphosphatidylglycerol synthase transmembrane domain-containing protein [bacterium]
MKLRIPKPVRVALEVLLLAGIVLLFVKILDPVKLRGYLQRVTLNSILGLLLFQLSIHLVGMLQWVVLLRESGLHCSAWRVFWSRLSGTAVTSLTPSAYFGGEPVRAAMVKDDSMSYRQIFATIAVDKYIELFTKFPIAVVGFGCLIFLAHPSTTLVVVSSVFVATFFALFFFLMVRLFQGGTFIMRFFKTVLRPLTRLRPRLAVKVIHPVRDFTRSVSHLIKSRRAFYLAMSLGLLLSVVELLQYGYVLSVLDIWSLADAAIIFFGHVFLGIFSFIPGNVGSMEGVFLTVFALLGLGSDRSLIFSMIMRIGQIIMVALGIGNIVISRLTRRVGKGADRIRTGA